MPKEKQEVKQPQPQQDQQLPQDKPLQQSQPLQQPVKATKREKVEEMTLEEARARRAALYKAPQKALTEKEKREAFRAFWAQNKKKYGKSKALEEILWLHLKSSDMDLPEKFEAGLEHFGLRKSN